MFKIRAPQSHRRSGEELNTYYRPFNSDDAEIFRFWYHHVELQSFFRGYIYGASRQDCVNAPDIMKGYILMAFTEDDLPFGMFTMSPSDTVLKNYNVGFLVSPPFQGCGCGYTLGKAGVIWAFDKLNAQKVTAKTVDPRLDIHLVNMGFVLEGISRQSCFFNGKIYDEKIYSLLKQEYDYGRIISEQRRENSTVCSDDRATEETTGPRDAGTGESNEHSGSSSTRQ